ncbi:MAG TPA: ATP-binding protein [Burkholderiales bacterium]|nr:ATP-binding protein [Burkholderiales bacterium]
MAMTQRARVLWVIVLVIAPLVVLTGVLLWQQLREDEQRIAEDRLQLARAAAFATEAFLDGHVVAARAIAAGPALRSGVPGRALDETLRTIAAVQPDWEGLGLIGSDGMSISSSQGAPGVYLGDRAYFLAAMRERRPVVSAALIGRVSGKTTVVVAAPVAFTGGGTGVLVVPLPTDRFAAKLREKMAAPSLRLTVVDLEGQAFIRPDPNEIAELERLSGPEIEAVVGGKAGIRFDGATLLAYAPVESYGWGVLLSESASSAFGAARRDALERAAVVIVILGVVFGLGWILAGRVALYAERADRLSGDLKRALQTRDEFLAAAAHDLRNPLSTIQVAGELVERAAQGPGAIGADQLARCAEHILSAARRMTRLLNAFLDVAHLQVGRPLELDKAPADFAGLVRQVVLECQHTTGRHRIVYEGPDELALEIDGPRLQRAVENVIGNALKYSPDGGEIRVRLQARDADVLLSVADRGVGIPPEDLERVFERFERGRNVARRFSGTGIGLAAARQIVEQHGGTLAVESELGKGSTFTMHFFGLPRVAQAQWQSLSSST